MACFLPFYFFSNSSLLIEVGACIFGFKADLGICLLGLEAGVGVHSLGLGAGLGVGARVHGFVIVSEN